MDNFSKNREDIRLRKSREKLFSLCSTKIRTTMIGAISDIESLFSDAVKDNPELFQELRSSILDRGNNQIRNLENDLYDYDINQKNSNLNTIYLPVKRKGQ
jgi:hypothetical protein